MAINGKHLRCLVLSDTHDFEKTAAKNVPLNQTMPKVDIVLHCGDLTRVGGASAYKKALNMLEDFDAELKLVIAGNHDLELDAEYWRTHLKEGDKPEDHEEALSIMNGPLAKQTNITYLTEGLHNFTLKNGTSFSVFASPYQPEFNDWAFGYAPDADRWSIPKDVDIVMTHGPPYGVLDTAHGQHLGCKTLLKAVSEARPRLHCFGHIHEGYGMKLQEWTTDWWSVPEKVDLAKISKAGTPENIKRTRLVPDQSTLMVNAAIMDERYQPTNAPWLVELFFA